MSTGALRLHPQQARLAHGLGWSQSAVAALNLAALHTGATFLRILSVDYVHVKTAEKGDLYLTEYGVPFLRHLLPENWLTPQWFNAKRQRLDGSGTVYRLPTKPVTGHTRPSIELAIKWSRVGQDVPLDTFTLNRNIDAEFNSPFEEFALVEELRQVTFARADCEFKRKSRWQFTSRLTSISFGKAGDRSTRSGQRSFTTRVSRLTSCAHTS